MKTKIQISMVSLMCVLMLSAAAGVNPVAGDVRRAETKVSFIPEDVILNPGWRTSCHRDFVLENLDPAEAEVAIQLGIEPFARDSIPANGKRLYRLETSLAFAKQLGKTVTLDDVAIIMNQSENSRVRVHC
ncbi:MAG: hypothetical protein GWM98_18160 [Nitrospinaceae bacterium]|nr:hypothetical protein [Nitrospinaceae bacterium]NIR55592.1 hypothetical protein [Nitrospinaceae bacterium]NIS86026.1 hypothetical protein [Nitrospinaceae bacterium]NIT83348.1 hypothetical protein [Nitrospinaceae bacterium]NIU45074.1 hypothetical protein [Nitrospinaceae bacterium]